MLDMLGGRAHAAGEDDRLTWLADSVARNRFLPQPPENLADVGDGDFRAIGAEFLGHLVRLGGLTPVDRVLDVGCGTGRLAVPLTQYLDPDRGTYVGVDPVRRGIDWCGAAITPAYPNFTFRHLDVGHPIYNPGGSLRGDTVRLPFARETFDFAFMVSVATHLPPAEVLAYGREIGRLLAPGGRLFLTAFVVDATPETGSRRLAFTPVEGGPAWIADAASPLAAVAFAEGFLDQALGQAGLNVIGKNPGHWRGGSATNYQDILIAEKREQPG